MCFNKIAVNFCKIIMQIRIIATKQKLNYHKSDITLGSKLATIENYFPLFELIMKELDTDQMKNAQRSKI